MTVNASTHTVPSVHCFFHTKRTRARRLLQRERNRFAHAIYHAFGGTGHGKINRLPVMKRVHNQVGIARPLIKRIARQFNGNSRRSGVQQRSNGGKQRDTQHAPAT